MTETLVLNDGSTNHNFVATKMLGDGRERIDDTTDLLAPSTLAVRHSKSTSSQGNPDGVTVDRHLVQLSNVQRDTDTEQAFTTTVNFTIAVPRSSLFAAADVAKLVAMVTDCVSDNLNALLRGEV